MVMPRECGSRGDHDHGGQQPPPSGGRTINAETGPPARMILKERRHLFWKPMSCGTLLQSGNLSEPADDDVEGRWLHSAAEAIERAMMMLPSVDELEGKDCLTAAIYVEAARNSLRIACDSLRLTSQRSVKRDLDEMSSIDPLLAEWLH